LPKIYHLPKIFINADVNENEVNGATCLSIQSQDINIIVNQMIGELGPAVANQEDSSGNSDGNEPKEEEEKEGEANSVNDDDHDDPDEEDFD